MQERLQVLDVAEEMSVQQKSINLYTFESENEN